MLLLVTGAYATTVIVQNHGWFLTPMLLARPLWSLDIVGYPLLEVDP